MQFKLLDLDYACTLTKENFLIEQKRCLLHNNRVAYIMFIFNRFHILLVELICRNFVCIRKIEF